jgi:hypothetical protein
VEAFVAVVVVVAVVVEKAGEEEGGAAVATVGVVVAVDVDVEAAVAGLVVGVADTLFLEHAFLVEKEHTAYVASGFVQVPALVRLAP